MRTNRQQPGMNRVYTRIGNRVWRNPYRGNPFAPGSAQWVPSAFALFHGLDSRRLLWYRRIMLTIRETLRNAIKESGMSDRNLGMLAGVNRLSIGRFMAGQTSLTLDQAERLACFFGLELQPERKKERK